MGHSRYPDLEGASVFVPSSGSRFGADFIELTAIKTGQRHLCLASFATAGTNGQILAGDGRVVVTG
ncbi:MAG: hypothetical protein AAF871_03055 [Pseudomonadota bacterium]